MENRGTQFAWEPKWKYEVAYDNPGTGSDCHSALRRRRAGSRRGFRLRPDLAGQQGSHINAQQGKPGAFIFMADRWRPQNHADGRYIWLPIQWEGDKPILKWMDEWSLQFFNR